MRPDTAPYLPGSFSPKVAAVLRRIDGGLRSLTLRKQVLWGVCLLALAIPLRQVIRLPGLGTLTKFVGLAVFPLAVAEVLRQRSIRPLREVHVLILAFACWVALSYFWSIDPDRTFDQVWTVTQLVALLWLVWEFAQSRTQIHWVLLAFVSGAYIVAGATLLDYFSDPSGPSRYSSAPGVQPNGVAFLLGLAIPVAWYLSHMARPLLLKALLVLYLPFALLASLLTGSRGGLFTTGAALCIVPLTLRRVTFKRKAVLAIGLLIGAIGVLVLLPTRPVQRLTTTSSEIREGDFHNRRALWDAALAAFDERPLGGIGAGASPVRIRQITDREQGAHNTFLSIAAELGVVGLSLFCLILLAMGRMILISTGLQRKLGLVLMVTLLLGLLPRHWEYDMPTWLTLALLIGVAGFSPAHNYHSPATEGPGVD